MVGNGANEAILKLNGGIHSFVDELHITNNASLTCNGTILGNVVNRGGTISPGCSPGLLTIDGNLTMETNSVLDLEIAGYDPGEYDFLGVTGAVTFGGELLVNFIDGFGSVITNGSSFTFLTADNTSLVFSDFNRTSSDGGLFLVTYDESADSFSNIASGQYMEVPEPGVMMLLAAGGLMLIGNRRKRR